MHMDYGAYAFMIPALALFKPVDSEVRRERQWVPYPGADLSRDVAVRRHPAPGGDVQLLRLPGDHLDLQVPEPRRLDHHPGPVLPPGLLLRLHPLLPGQLQEGRSDHLIF